MIRKPRPGNPKPAIDHAKARRVADLSRHASERMDKVMSDVTALLEGDDEVLSVVTNVAVALAANGALYMRRSTGIPGNGKTFFLMLGRHIASLALKADET